MTHGTLIDISAAINQGAGIGRYARELTRELVPMMPSNSTRLWYAADDHAAEPELVEQPPWNSLSITRSRISRRNVDRLFVRAQLPVGKLIGSGSPVNSYSPDYTTPTGEREHVTIHDLAWLHPEALTPPGLAHYLAPVVERAVRRASTIFTVSQTVREELLQRYGLPEERVIVASNAAAPHFFHANPLSEPDLVTLGIRSAFLLYVGTVEPRKNLPRLFEAMTHVPEDVMLVVAGKDGWESPHQLAPIARLGLERRVLRLGYVSETQLAGLYAASAAVVYPSRYEGFGLPIVEGLAVGVPVVASDLPVFHEVGGDQVQFFDPIDPASIAASLMAGIELGSSQLARERRQAQSRRFRWHVSAETVARRLQALS